MVGKDYKYVEPSRSKGLKKSGGFGIKAESKRASKLLSIIAFSMIVSFLAGLYIGIVIGKGSNKVSAEFDRINTVHRGLKDKGKPSHKTAIIERWLKEIDLYEKYNLKSIPKDELDGYYIKLVRFKKEDNAKVTIGYLRSKKLRAYCKIEQNDGKKTFIIYVGPYKRKFLAQSDLEYIREMSKMDFKDAKVVYIQSQ